MIFIMLLVKFIYFSVDINLMTVITNAFVQWTDTVHAHRGMAI